jgi:hypothetical protein
MTELLGLRTLLDLPVRTRLELNKAISINNPWLSGLAFQQCGAPGTQVLLGVCQVGTHLFQQRSGRYLDFGVIYYYFQVAF